MALEDSEMLNGRTILVVEDQAVLRETVVLQLLGAGAVAVGCGSAEEMADRLAAGGCAPDLVLLDLTLPGRSGLEALRSLRSDLRWQALPVVIITADDDRQAVDAALAAGCDAYLTKPVRMAQLIDACRRAVPGRAAA